MKTEQKTTELMNYPQMTKRRGPVEIGGSRGGRLRRRAGHRPRRAKSMASSAPKRCRAPTPSGETSRRNESARFDRLSAAEVQKISNCNENLMIPLLACRFSLSGGVAYELLVAPCPDAGDRDGLG
jgi:hypothetical protein